MTAALVAAVLALHPAPQTPGTYDPFRGSQESAAPRLNHSSSGMTLEALRGLPRTRPTWTPPRPQVWVYPSVVVYPAYSPSLGGYRPPGVGRSYRSSLWWGW